MTPTFTRRGFGALTLGAGLGAMAAPALAQSRTVSAVVSAIYKPSFDAYIVPKMKELHGIDVQASPMLSAEALARAIAQKSNPAIDLFTLDQGPWLQGRDLGLWTTLKTDVVANLADIPEAFRDPEGKGSALFSNLTVLVYDEAALTKAGVAPPAALMDLWKPEFKNRISIPQFTNTYAFVTLARVTELMGGDPAASFDQGFEKIKELKPNVRTFMGPLGQVIQLFQQEEIWACFVPHFSAAQSAAAGLPVKWTVPSEGGVAVSHYLAVPENAANAEEAQLLADMMLSPGFQAYIAEHSAMGIVNQKTELSAEVAARFPTAEQTIAAAQVPWALYNAQRTDLADRWQREIQD